MPKRKQRIRVMLDTNVLIRHFISHTRGKKHGFNRRIFELWFIKSQIQLVVSSEIVEEYIATLEFVLGFTEDVLKKWQSRFFSHNADAVSPASDTPPAVIPKTIYFSPSPQSVERISSSPTTATCSTSAMKTNANSSFRLSRPASSSNNGTRFSKCAAE